MTSFSYQPIQKQWRKLGPLYRSEEAKRIWYPAMREYQRSRMDELNAKYAYPKNTPDLRPSHFDSCDWQLDRKQPGPAPVYWEYVCFGACHWLANLHLWVAWQAEPKYSWMIVTSEKHSLVWNGRDKLWDANFMAIGVSTEEAWNLAAKQPDSEEITPGEFLEFEGVPVSNRVAC